MIAGPSVPLRCWRRICTRSPRTVVAAAAAHRRFPPPVQVPPTWWQLAHHAAVVSAVLGTVMLAPAHLPPVSLVVVMFLYSDAYSAVLHCALDREEALGLPRWTGLGKTAEGFQVHHDHPMASTRGVGLYRLFCDTVKIQWVTGALALATASWTLLTAQVLLLKWLCCAYGTQLGHYWSHVPAGGRPAVVRWLQAAHLLLPPEHHVQGHHKPPHNKHFGIVSGLSNYFINPFLRDAPFAAVFAVLVFLTIFDVALIVRVFSMQAWGV